VSGTGQSTGGDSIKKKNHSSCFGEPTILLRRWPSKYNYSMISFSQKHASNAKRKIEDSERLSNYLPEWQIYEHVAGLEE